MSGYQDLISCLIAADRADRPNGCMQVLICVYNTRHNPCRERPHHPGYRPLETWEDSRVKEIGKKQCDALCPVD